MNIMFRMMARRLNSVSQIQNLRRCPMLMRRFLCLCSSCKMQPSHLFSILFNLLNFAGDFIAVFDGHGGPAVSRYLRKNLYANVQAFLPLVVSEKQDERSVGQDTKKDTSDDNNEREELHVAKIINRESIIHNNISSSRRPRNPTVNDYAKALESALEKVDREILNISHCF